MIGTTITAGISMDPTIDDRRYAWVVATNDVCSANIFWSREPRSPGMINSNVRNVVKQLLPAGVRVYLSGEKLLRLGEPEARLLKEYVRPGSVAIDVGANVGKYSYALAKLVGPNGRVICIEPVEEHARMLGSAARQLRMPLDVRTCAVSERPGFATLHIPMEDGRLLTGLAGLDVSAETVDRREVATTTIDLISAEVDRHISFIKIDIEGHEYDVLKGAGRTLAKHKPALLVEIEERHSGRPVEDVFRLLAGYGYDGFFLDSARRRIPIHEFSAEGHQRQHMDNPFSRDYINNFMFVRKEEFETIA